MEIFIVLGERKKILETSLQAQNSAVLRGINITCIRLPTLQWDSS